MSTVHQVRYGESGWKERYYAHKLQVHKGDEAMKRYVVGCYVQGLCWTLMYYYQGVQDWGWFYPFHYAPCASDIIGYAPSLPMPSLCPLPYALCPRPSLPYALAMPSPERTPAALLSMQVLTTAPSLPHRLHEFAGGQFTLGAPFTPFQQLMAVFPPSSGHALPESYRTLMVIAPDCAPHPAPLIAPDCAAS
jgi:hypothetical protein